MSSADVAEIDNATYDPSVSVTMVGRAGLFKGEEVVIRLGQCVVVGRSRMCDVSVARTAECQRLGKEAMENHRSYRKISRKHLRVCVLGHDLVEIEDLSTNGTLVNGHRIDRLQVSRFLSDRKSVTIEFGDGEVLVVTPGANAAKYPSTEVRTEGRRSIGDEGHDGAEDRCDPLEQTPVQ